MLLPAIMAGSVSGEAFSPLDIPWVNAYWTEGPNFLALGLADGDPITTWPTETGTGNDMATLFGTPLYRASVASFDNKPGIEVFGAEGMNVSTSSMSQPWTAVAIVRRNGGNTSAAYFGSGTDAAGRRGLTRSAFGAGTPLGHADQDGPAIIIGLANGTSSEVWTQAGSIVTGDAGGFALSRATAFTRQTAAATNPMTGWACFFATINRALTTDERTALTTWAVDHYGL